MPKLPIIAWDRPMLERFKVAWGSAPGGDGSKFTFDGHDFLKGYAEYLIEFLDKRLPKASAPNN